MNVNNDVILRGNYFYNVTSGFFSEHTTSGIFHANNITFYEFIDLLKIDFKQRNISTIRLNINSFNKL